MYKKYIYLFLNNSLAQSPIFKNIFTQLPREPLTAYILRLAYPTLSLRIFSSGNRCSLLLKKCAGDRFRPISGLSHSLHFTFHTKSWLGEPGAMTSEIQTGTVTYDNKQYDIVKEGLAEILNLRSAPTDLEEDNGENKGTLQPQAVFYNPIQQYNRDLSVLAIRTFGQDLTNIRKARHERRLQESLKKEPTRGKKRKRKEEENSDSIEPRAGSSKRSADEIINREHENGTANDATSKSTIANQATGKPEKSLSSDTDPGDDVEQFLLDPDTDLQDGFDYDGVPKGPKELHELNPQDGGNGGSSYVLHNKGVTPPKHRFRILDALSATGLRAIRYAKEIPLVTSVTANDLSSSATASIKLNVRHNELDGKILTVTGDALAHMYRTAFNINPDLSKSDRGKYDVIDLDPYGSAAHLLDAAVQALSDGGLLCVTCTDSAVFASTGYLEKTFSLYGGLPGKGPQAHEVGLRLILHAIASSAARHGIAIEPLLSLSIDFYARIFVRIHRSPVEVKFLAGKTTLVYSCDTGCGAWSTQLVAQNRAKKNKQDLTYYKFALSKAPTTHPTCEHCGFKTHLSGPMWGGPLHNPHFIERILDELPFLSKERYGTIPRIEGMLSTALNETLLDSPQEPPPPPLAPSQPEELTPSIIPSLDPAHPDHHPFFLIPSTLAKVLHCEAPPDAALRGAFLHLGYRVTRSHTKPGSIRTDAPWPVIWEVMREWIRQKKPIKPGAIKKGTAGWAIMQKDRSKIDIQSLKADLAAIMEKAEDVEKAKVEIEAALYRAGKLAGKLVDGGSGSTGPATEGGSAAGAPKGEDDKPKSKAADESENVGEKESPHIDASSSWLARSKLKIVFDEKLGKEREAKRMVRYQLNPRAHWGPMSRAKGGDA